MRLYPLEHEGVPAGAYDDEHRLWDYVEGGWTPMYHTCIACDDMIDHMWEDAWWCSDDGLWLHDQCVEKVWGNPHNFVVETRILSVSAREE